MGQEKIKKQMLDTKIELENQIEDNNIQFILIIEELKNENVLI